MSNILLREEIEKKLKKLPGWWLVDHKISKQFVFKDFSEAMEFVSRLGKLFEKLEHHADIHVFYNKVILDLQTHEAHGVTKKDLSTAEQIEKSFKRVK